MKLLKGLIFFITLFALSRIIPHPPNFTPLISGVIFLPYLLEDKRAILLLPIAIMFLTDLVLGLHGLMIWTYSSFLLIGAWPIIMGITMFIQDFINLHRLTYSVLCNYKLWRLDGLKLLSKLF